MTRNDAIASLAVNSWINGGRVVWPGANLRRADLHRADLRRADLRWANLRRADLHRADLRRADLRGADLSEAVLTGANPSECDLSGCDLHGANLRGCDLRGCDLRGCDLTGAKITLGNRTFTLNEGDCTMTPTNYQIIEEAARRWMAETGPRRESVIDYVIDTVRENWTPPKPVDPDILAFREWLSGLYPASKANILQGCRDLTADAEAYLAGARMAREQERERAKGCTACATLAKYRGEA